MVETQLITQSSALDAQLVNFKNCKNRLHTVVNIVVRENNLQITLIYVNSVAMVCIKNLISKLQPNVKIVKKERNMWIQRHYVRNVYRANTII